VPESKMLVLIESLNSVKPLLLDKQVLDQYTEFERLRAKS